MLANSMGTGTENEREERGGNGEMTGQQAAADAIFEGPGEMRAFCRELDWAATPLGPVAAWPASLRTAAQMVLAAGLPNIVLWGEQLTQLYNDAYATIIGAKHPYALGRGNAEVWPEVWHINGPIFQRVLAGETVVLEDQLYPLQRGGGDRPRDDAYLTVSFSPIRDEDGVVAGVLANMIETTTQVRLRELQEDRQRMLRGLQVEQARLEEVFRRAPAFLAVLRGPEHVFELANEAYFELVGRRDLVGRPLADALPDVAGQGFDALLDRVLASGEPYVGREVPVLLVREAGAAQEERFVDFVYLPQVNADGERTGVIAHGTDVTAQVLARREVEAQIARFRAVHDASPDGFVLMHAVRAGDGTVLDFEYLYRNPAAARFTEGAGPQLVGRRLLEVFPHLRASGIFAAYVDVLLGGMPFQVETDFVQDGLDATFRVSAVRAATDEVAVTFADVSERERLIRAERAAHEEARATRDQLVRIISEAPVSMYIARGREHVYEIVNEAWCSIVGRSADSVVGRSMRAAFPELSAQGIYELVERVYDSGEPAAFPAQRIEIATGDGLQEHFFNIVYQPLRDADGQVDAMAVVATDVTELAQARRDAEEARGVAEAANRAKSDFLAVMSHELRTPLNAIQGYAELMELGIHGPVSDEQREALRRIQTSQRHLLGLVNGVLNYARVESGSISYDLVPVAVGTTFVTCEALLAPQARARHLTLHVQEPEHDLAVLADVDKLQQVLLNLLSNAVKFTDAGGLVVLSCEAGAERVDIRVRDTGRGIAPDQLARIFEPFVQVDARLTRAHDGTGLGLAISRDLARGMGGDLVVQSTPGEGSVFSLVLPRA